MKIIITGSPKLKTGMKGILLIGKKSLCEITQCTNKSVLLLWLLDELASAIHLSGLLSSSVS